MSNQQESDKLQPLTLETGYCLMAFPPAGFAVGRSVSNNMNPYFTALKQSPSKKALVSVINTIYLLESLQPSQTSQGQSAEVCQCNENTVVFLILVVLMSLKLNNDDNMNRPSAKQLCAQIRWHENLLLSACVKSKMTNM